MDWRVLLDAGPIVVALAGPNGAGKSTFFSAHLSDTGLRFVNADDLAAELGMGASEAAELAASLRAGLVEQRESFVFETVLSDPVGAKVAELVETARKGIHVGLVFIRLDSPETAKQRVAMRVMQGGHDVPDATIEARFERALVNLERAITALPVVVVFGNTDLARPFQLEAVYQTGTRIGP